MILVQWMFCSLFICLLHIKVYDLILFIQLLSNSEHEHNTNKFRRIIAISLFVITINY